MMTKKQKYAALAFYAALNGALLSQNALADNPLTTLPEVSGTLRGNVKETGDQKTQKETEAVLRGATAGAQKEKTAPEPKASPGPKAAPEKAAPDKSKAEPKAAPEKAAPDKSKAEPKAKAK